VLHISGYGVHPLMLALSLLALPMLFVTRYFTPPTWFFGVVALPMALSILGPSIMYVCSQWMVSPLKGVKSIFWMPVLMFVGVGLAVSNTRAIMEALRGHESEFVRTPKRGDNEVRRYRGRFSRVALIELALGAYVLLTIHYYMSSARFGVVPFLMMYAGGFLFMGTLSIWQATRTAR
jgi:hypothetical protein